jgi:hypothetical protein
VDKGKRTVCGASCNRYTISPYLLQINEFLAGKSSGGHQAKKKIKKN